MLRLVHEGRSGPRCSARQRAYASIAAQGALVNAQIPDRCATGLLVSRTSRTASSLKSLPSFLRVASWGELSRKRISPHGKGTQGERLRARDLEAQGVSGMVQDTSALRPVSQIHVLVPPGPSPASRPGRTHRVYHTGD